jgi:hypothetical protein
MISQYLRAQADLCCTDNRILHIVHDSLGLHLEAPGEMPICWKSDQSANPQVEAAKEYMPLNSSFALFANPRYQ